jgi:cytochrome c biogenesis protein CcdA
VTFGVLLTSFGLGLRHGIDWDHIAAITDLSGTAPDRRRGFILSMIYAVGHAAVVFALGTLAIVAGAAIPDSVDHWMSRIVGLTLIALGVWILLELARKGRDFRLRSRWMLIINGTFAGLRRVRDGLGSRRISVDHVHTHEHVDAEHETAHAHDHAHVAVAVESEILEPVAAGRFRSIRPLGQTHEHRHHHDLVLKDDATASYGSGAAAGIGMLHGIGIESPTQIAIFVASTAVAGTTVGLALLGAWVIGLIVANAGLAMLAGMGMLQADRSYPVYATLAVVLGVASLVMGTLYLTGLV